ncbi:MAG: tetraacyldisaccharide 4'-kinase [Candidatus Omnitrophota bacterium]|nr:tetraacyldisaccharide 4'-kinase [Candidatus Omnitrophota bacterium]
MHSFLYSLATDKYRGLKLLPIKFFLYFLSLFYGLIVITLASFERLRRRRLSCKVISIGNITLGGTGKTSLVEYLARYLKEQGRQVAILSRGYKREKISRQSMGDEPFMLQQKLKNIPVIIDADRIKGAKSALKDYGADTVILDDGFQQWRLVKDLEIVTIDALNPFGNRHLLPRGTLREPLSSLKRADIFILTKTNLSRGGDGLKSFLNRLNPRALICESLHRPAGFYDFNNPAELLEIDRLKGESVTLFCGIGDPDSFERLIKNLGIKAVLSFKFPDHHNYSEEDFKKITEESRRRNINILVTTEKDAARLCAQRPTPNAQRPTPNAQRILVLRIELVIKNDDQERLYNRLLTLYPL